MYCISLSHLDISFLSVVWETAAGRAIILEDDEEEEEGGTYLVTATT